MAFASANTNTFVQFGCWNQGSCNEELVNPLSKVMHTLRQFSLEEKPDFIVVAGDNYYPEKAKTKDKKNKKKIIDPGNLAAGFHCLPSNVEIDMILGNHDLETNGENATLFLDDGTVEQDCFITRREKELTTTPSNITFVVNKARTLGIDEDTLLLEIDTSMYDDEDIPEMLPCYKKMAGYTDIDSIDALRQKQFAFIEDALATFQGRNIILVGHHPITGYKKKNDEIKLIKAFPSFIEMLLNIFAVKGAAVNYYYLCADLHLYQEGTIVLPTEAGPEMRINQYIVGTGGTKLDDDVQAGFPSDDKGVTFKENIGGMTVGSYKMDAGQCSRSIEGYNYGFLVCNFTNSANLLFEFISVPMGASLEGGRRLNKTRRNKRSNNKKTKRINKRSKSNKRSNKRTNKRSKSNKRTNKRTNKRSNNKRITL